jgi:DNA-binding transcriptional ArsR family regulator
MARSATRSRSAEAAAAPARAIVRDFSRASGAPYEVEFDVRTVYDFLFSLSVDAGTTEDLPEADRVWLREAKASLPAALRTELDERFGADICVIIAGLAVGRPELVDAQSFVDFLRAVNPREFVRMLLGEYHRDPALSPFLDRALGGDPAAIERIRLELDEHKLSLADRLLGDPTELIRSTVAILEAWLERFAPIEERIRSMIRRDADTRVADRATLEPIDLIEKVTGGIRTLPEPGIRRVILAPSYFARPYNFHLTADDWKFFGYPIADSALEGTDPLAPPAAVVRLHRALGDETRLRILRLLANRDHYLTEIAGALELSKPTIKHHLALLRAAGLVTLTEEGGLSYYSLRRGTIEATGGGLKDYLRA